MRGIKDSFFGKPYKMLSMKASHERGAFGVLKSSVIGQLAFASLLALSLLVSFMTPVSAAPEEVPELFPKTLSAAIAFSVAVISAGFGIARAGSAGLAAAAERPEIRTTAIIVAAFAEALAIYGIVIAFFILGA
ncbi:MAG: ATP synthase subunit C [Nitrososphaerota archaeon]